ncbi:hypothetical protein CSUI_009071 [Cystoisospora suis]|uniref:Uncharacterized protein n=1 Tax=Cystoisospora suis TaxID=483139 RepID=A0A2C6KHT8_9APIC|nr:hypothetical protein CSUI_009071 [Cystoisospora suis]
MDCADRYDETGQSFALWLTWAVTCTVCDFKSLQRVTLSRVLLPFVFGDGFSRGGTPFTSSGESESIYLYNNETEGRRFPDVHTAS